MFDNALEFIMESTIKYDDFYLYGNIPESKAINAINTYGNKEDKQEDILALFDATIFGSAKVGFYITPFSFCYHDEDGNKMVFDIREVESFDYKKSVPMNYLVINSIGGHGTKMSTRAQFNCYGNKFLEPSKVFLNKLLMYIKQDFIKAIEEVELQDAKEEEAKRIEAQKIEEVNKAKLKQQAINNVFEPTTDEFLNRTNGLFISLNSIHDNLQAVILFLAEIQLKLSLMELDYNEINFFELLKEFSEYKNKFEEFEVEYQKMVTVSEIVQSNRSVINQRLNIIKNEIENYERAIKIVDNFFFNIFDFEISRLEENEEKARKVIQNFIKDVVVITEFKKKHFDEEAKEEYVEYQNKDSSSILTSFFDKNQDTILGKLKGAGFVLSASALQNDTNIIKIANIIYNLLPTPIRFIVGVDIVENFLLKNREWLINKLI